MVPRHLLLTALAATLVLAAAPRLTAAQPDMAPTNSHPNPYRTIEGFAKMPAGRTWGSTSAVAIDKDGTGLWVAERCGANSCLGSNLDPILRFDANGNLLKSFGAGMIIFPHGIWVDRDGNVWVTDGRDNAAGARRGGGAAAGGAAGAAAATPPPVTDPIGHQVFKFSPDGQLLLTLGKKGGGRDTAWFYQPNAILVAPNGDIFVSEGHSSAATANARVLKFDRTGKFLMQFGKRGSGQGEFDQPHALAMDSQGRLFVGDRGNNRIQIFDQNGKYLDMWYQFSRPSGLFIDANDVIYVADSESGSVNPAHVAWKRGIRIGSAKDGSLTAFIPDPAENPPSTSAAEGVAVDKNGVIYGAEVGPRALKRYVKGG